MRQHCIFTMQPFCIALSARSTYFTGSEMGWYRTDILQIRTRPTVNGFPQDHFTKSYYGYFDIWGLKDAGIDDLGTGPAIVTNGPPGAGKAGFQRSAATPQGGGDPPFQSERGRLNIRHLQRFSSR